MTDPLDGLHGIDLPAAGWPEAAAAAALGLSLALILRAGLRFVAVRPLSKRAGLMAELEAMKDAPAAERLHGQAKLLKRLAPGAMPELDAALYERTPRLSPDDVHRRLAALIKTGAV